MSWLNDYLPAGQPVLDASVIINLLATQEPVEVLRALGHKSLVEQRTLREVRRHPVPGLPLEPVLDELRSLVLLEEVRMPEEEYDVYLGHTTARLGTRLDDGESAALAVAARGACVVLDDFKARKTAATRAPGLVVVSSLRLFISSASRGGWQAVRIKKVVRQAVQHAKMGVPLDERSLLAQVLGY